jgi:putative ABC transport system permease protein
MNLAENIALALRGLAANRLRAGLTALGIFIGVLAVILGTAVGQGSRTKILSSIEALGSNSIYIIPQNNREGRVAGEGARLTLRDLEIVRRECPSLIAVAPEIQRPVKLKYRNRTSDSTVVATSPEAQTISNWSLESGRFLSHRDVRGRRKVCVIGQKVVENLFGKGAGSAALGRNVRVEGVNLRVIGVLKSKGASLFNDQDNQTLIPLTTGQKALFGVNTISAISAQTAKAEDATIASIEIDAALRRAHRLKPNDKADFGILTQSQFMKLGDSTAGILTLLLTGIAGIALLVGGIGIMNIMLVSVTERTREIGIRKAVGARRSDILQQFLIEAMTLSIVGGLAGIGAGVAISALIRSAFDFPAAVSPMWATIAFCTSAAIGIFFGIYPATKAAALDPIEALRYQ